MIRTLSVLALLAVLAAGLLAGPAAAQRIDLGSSFDARRLTEVEQRYLQAALAFEGDYLALIDGAWGRGSQRALERWAAREARGGRATWGAVRTLVRAFEAERAASGWVQVWHDGEGIGLLMPLDLLTPVEGGQELRYVSPDGGLVLLYRLDRALPGDLHDEFRRDIAPGADAYTTTSADRRITAGEMRGGRHAYVRSDRAGDRWGTHVVLSDAANRGRLRVIASSFSRREAPQMDLPPGGVLARLADGTGGAGARIGPPAPSAPEARGDDLAQDLLAGALTLLLDRALDRSDLGGRRAEVPAAPATPGRVRDRGLRSGGARDGDGRDGRRGGQAGVGAFVNTTDVLTSDEVLRACRRGVETMDGVRAEVVARDAGLDLAVLALPGRSRAWLPVDAREAETGRRVRVLAALPRGVEAREGRVTRAASRRQLRHDIDVGLRLLGAPLMSARGGIAAVAQPRGGFDGGAPTRAVPGEAVARFLDDSGIVHATGEGPRDVRVQGEATVRLRCAR